MNEINGAGFVLIAGFFFLLGMVVGWFQRGRVVDSMDWRADVIELRPKAACVQREGLRLVARPFDQDRAAFDTVVRSYRTSPDA